ncbi:MAG: putative metal-binding motif-containing protein [Myxococcaceae bacterium]|nr:putative metal-binding motif-containing protein [Myxococcaceae bacterium]
MTRSAPFILVVASACTLSVSTPGLEVVAIEPAQGFAQAEREIVLKGSFVARVKVDFEHPEASERDERFGVRLERDGDQIELQNVRLVDPQTLAALVPAGIAPGSWNVLVSGPWANEARLAGSFDVLDCLEVRCVLPDGSVVEPEENDTLMPPPPVICGELTFADADGDGRGAAGTGAMLCGTGRVSSAGDCDDGDRDAAPGEPERCNGVDDDCDGLVDEGVCPVMNPNWVRRLDTGGANQDWVSVAAYAGGAWLVGGDDLFLRTGTGMFAAASGGCPRSLTAAWASASGELFLGGEGEDEGEVAQRLPSGSACRAGATVDEPVIALVGFEAGGLVGLMDDGVTFSWSPPQRPERGSLVSPLAKLRDLHGSSPTDLYAVGSTNAGRTMRVYRYDASRRRWAREYLSRLSLPSGALRSVWVLGRTSVFAVGDDGVVIEKTAAGWRRLPSPGQVDLTAVRAFNPSRVYVTTADGRVLRWNGRAWQALFRAPSGGAFSDLGGVSENELWAVGANGLVAHWPE